MDLPSINECKQFLGAINVGRSAIGLEPLDTLDFDNAEPGSPTSCLSATNLFAAAGATVGGTFVVGGTEGKVEAVAAALGMPLAEYEGVESGGHYKIPESITRVTDIFDSVDDAVELHALRERLVEAGVVA